MEIEKRSEDNASACDILHGNSSLWQHVGGPSLEILLRPSEETLAKAKECCEKVQKMKESDDRDGMCDSSCPSNIYIYIYTPC